MRVYILLVLVAATYSQNPYYPKEFDIKMIPESKNCVFTSLSEGTCAGGNWAHVFSSASYLTWCMKDGVQLTRLSGEHLLQCLNLPFDACKSTPQDLTFVDQVSQYKTCPKSFRYLSESGISTLECVPYDSYFSGKFVPTGCPTKCQSDSVEFSQWKSSVREVKTVNEIKDHLESRGPVVMAIKYKTSLNLYSNGEYQAVMDVDLQEDELEFGVRFFLITGWKTNAGGKTVWQAQNTFGPQWANFGVVQMKEDHEYILGSYVIDI